jgi:hypothetical protein
MVDLTKTDPDVLKKETALFGGVTGTSLVAAAQLLPAPFNAVVSASIPFVLAIILWYLPFRQMEFKMKEYQRLSLHIDQQLKTAALSEKTRKRLRIALEQANKRVIELQFRLFPQDADAARLVQELQAEADSDDLAPPASPELVKLPSPVSDNVSVRFTPS